MSEPTWTSDCGTVRLWLGDCLEVMQAWPDGAVDAVVTDIPYGQVNRPSGGLRSLDKGGADIPTFSNKDAARMASLARTCHVFCGTEQVSELRASLVDKGMTTRLGVWEKTNPSPMNGERLWLSSLECCVFGRKPGAWFSEKCKSPVWRGPVARNQVHTTQKPVWLMQSLVNAGCKPAGVVADFCMGSGTTGVAAVRLGRQFWGVEIDPEYFEIAKRRIKDELRRAAFLEGNLDGRPRQLTMLEETA